MKNGFRIVLPIFDECINPIDQKDKSNEEAQHDLPLGIPSVQNSGGDGGGGPTWVDGAVLDDSTHAVSVARAENEVRRQCHRHPERM